jgi:hypothetical protein
MENAKLSAVYIGFQCSLQCKALLQSALRSEAARGYEEPGLHSYQSYHTGWQYSYFIT